MRALKLIENNLQFFSCITHFLDLRDNKIHRENFQYFKPCGLLIFMSASTPVYFSQKCDKNT